MVRILAVAALPWCTSAAVGGAPSPSPTPVNPGMLALEGCLEEYKLGKKFCEENKESMCDPNGGCMQRVSMVQTMCQGVPGDLYDKKVVYDPNQDGENWEHVDEALSKVKMMCENPCWAAILRHDDKKCLEGHPKCSGPCEGVYDELAAVCNGTMSEEPDENGEYHDMGAVNQMIAEMCRSTKDYPSCVDIGQGYFCGEGGCDCDHCCGTPWKPERQDCCHSHCTMTATPGVMNCEDQLCNAMSYPEGIRYTQEEDTSCGSAGRWREQQAKCERGECDGKAYAEQMCGEEANAWEEAGCKALDAEWTMCDGARLKGAKTMCGSDECKVIVYTEWDTCGEYCADAGLTCVQGWHAGLRTCKDLGDEVGCDRSFGPDEARVCQCGVWHEPTAEKPKPERLNRGLLEKCQGAVTKYMNCGSAQNDPDWLEGIESYMKLFDYHENMDCAAYENIGCMNPEQGKEVQATDELTCNQNCHMDKTCTSGFFDKGTAACYHFQATDFKVERVVFKGEPHKGLNWFEAARLAREAGGMLPSSATFKKLGLFDGDFDFWQPTSDGEGMWVQTGDAGRLYTTEGGSDANWWTNEVVQPWRPVSLGSDGGSGVHYYYIQHGGERACAWMEMQNATAFECSGPMPEIEKDEDEHKGGECKVTLYDNCFDGEEMHYGHGDHYLDTDFSHRTSSVMIEGNDCHVAFFHNHDMGDHQTPYILGEGMHNCDSFHFGDMAAALRVQHGYPHFGGNTPGTCHKTLHVSSEVVREAEALGYSVRRC